MVFCCECGTKGVSGKTFCLSCGELLITKEEINEYRKWKKISDAEIENARKAAEQKVFSKVPTLIKIASEFKKKRNEKN